MRRFTLVPLAAAGVALVLASCGGQEFPRAAVTPTSARPVAIPPAATANPRAWLLASVRRTSTVGTARLALSMKLVGMRNEAMSVTGDGEMDFANHEASLSMHGSDNREPISLDLRIVGGTVYTRTDTDWRSAPAAGAGVDTPNPASYLAYLQAVSSDVRVDGHETLRGVDTIRYRADIDFDRALAHGANAVDRKELAQAAAMLGGMKMPTTVWIDGDGHLRKVEFSLDLATVFRKAGLTMGGDPKIAVVLELYDFGIPVHVVAPPGAMDARAAAQARAAQSDLRNALTAEKTIYVDSQVYSADAAQMKQIEPALGWGGRLTVVVGDAEGVTDAVVCLSERSSGGQLFALADVAAGPNAGTYYGRSACPASVDDASMARLGSRW